MVVGRMEGPPSDAFPSPMPFLHAAVASISAEDVIGAADEYQNGGNSNSDRT